MNPVQDPQSNPPANPPAPQPMPFLPPAARPEYFRDPRLKSPMIAAVLSLMPGVGQVYLGYTRLGFIHGVTAATLICLMSSNRLGALEPLFGVFMVFFWLYNLVDAHRRAVLLNEAIARLETPRLPDGFGTVSFGTRITAGAGLILFGTMCLLSLRFGVSFAWLERWWPMGVVLFGLYLVVKAVQDRSAETGSPQA